MYEIKMLAFGANETMGIVNSGEKADHVIKSLIERYGKVFGEIRFQVENRKYNQTIHLRYDGRSKRLEKLAGVC